MRWLDGKILTSFVMHMHFHVYWKSDALPFAFLTRPRGKSVAQTATHSPHYSIYRKNGCCVVTLAAAGSPFRPGRHPLAFPWAAAKKSTGRNYLLLLLLDLTQVAPKQAPLFSSPHVCAHDDNLYIGERPRLGVHDLKMSARQVIFQLVFCVLHFACEIYTHFFVSI
jgi:hypothetical protein